jgi:hypothetical protein
MVIGPPEALGSKSGGGLRDPACADVNLEGPEA